MIPSALLFAAGVVAAVWGPAAAQAPAQGPASAGPFAASRPAEILRSMHFAARNQLGILQYCQAQGAVGEDVVALQRRTVAALPPAQVDRLEEAEAAGRRGMIAFDGSEVAFADAARGQGATVRGGCRNLARSVQAQAGELSR